MFNITYLSNNDIKETKYDKRKQFNVLFYCNWNDSCQLASIMFSKKLCSKKLSIELSIASIVELASLKGRYLYVIDKL